jgi:hypothetical protein
MLYDGQRENENRPNGRARPAPLYLAIFYHVYESGRIQLGEVIPCPSREEELLSDHVFYVFGRSFTFTGREQLVVILAVAVLATAWGVLQFRRRRVVVLQRSIVSDQIAYDLSRIADALERISYRPADPVIPAPLHTSTVTSPPPAEEPTGRIPYSMFGR